MEEYSQEFFDFGRPSPYMTFVCAEISGKLPAVTHVDGSTRLQTVSFEQNPRFHQLLKTFYQLSGVPVLINTSFNTSKMPIVCSPQNAFQCFAESDLDAIVLGNSLILRSNIRFLDRKRNAC
jgi:carbamoyltransferase